MPQSPSIRVGCCGIPVKLSSYAELFRVVEVQQTFYQPPRVTTLARWRAQVPRDFEFTLKAWQLITHEARSPTFRRLREKLSDSQKREAGAFRATRTVRMAWQRTLESARGLEARVILFQCPASFTPTCEHKENLRAFFRGLRSTESSGREVAGLTFVWEPRGNWTPEEIRELCQEISLVHGGDPLQTPLVAGERGYFRLHGRGGFGYVHTDEDLRAILDAARAYPSCYVLFNNRAMLDDARRFQALLARA